METGLTEPSQSNNDEEEQPQLKSEKCLPYAKYVKLGTNAGANCTEHLCSGSPATLDY